MNTEKILKELYYDPSSGMLSLQKLYHKTKELGYKITQKQIKDFLEKQETHQLHKNQELTSHYFPIRSNYKNEIIQIDLADLSQISGSNNNTKYLLSVIDVFSRYAWVEPLKNKNTATITEVMNKIIGDMKPKPEIINCDNGSEFISSSFKKMCDKRSS